MLGIFVPMALYLVVEQDAYASCLDRMELKHILRELRLEENNVCLWQIGNRAEFTHIVPMVVNT